VITIRQRYGQTDGQTDRQTTCDRNTALCTKVHRAVKTELMKQRTSACTQYDTEQCPDPTHCTTSHRFTDDDVFRMAVGDDDDH